MLSLSNASLLSPPALSGAEGEAEGYAKTIWRPAASTLSKTGTGQASSAQVLGRTRRARAAGISPTKKEPFPPAFRTSMYLQISIDKMFHVEHFSILSATFTDTSRGRGHPSHTENRSAFRTSRCGRRSTTTEIKSGLWPPPPTTAARRNPPRTSCAA